MSTSTRGDLAAMINKAKQTQAEQSVALEKAVAPKKGAVLLGVIFNWFNFCL